MAEEEELEAAGGGNKKLMILGIVFGLLLVGGNGFLAYQVLGGGGDASADGESGEADAGDSEEEGGEGDKEPAALGHMVTLEPFVVNLSDVTEIHYLRIQIAVELKDEAAGKEFENKKVPVRDRVITYLSGLTMDDLRTPSDKDVVRQRLLEQIRDTSGNKGVRHIYFGEFMVQ